FSKSKYSVASIWRLLYHNILIIICQQLFLGSMKLIMKNVSVYFDGFINIPQIDVSFQYVKRIFFYVAILKATFITLPCKMKKVNFILLLYRIDKTNLSD